MPNGTRIKMKVVCYARVSRRDMNPENQFTDLRKRGGELGEYELFEERESTRKERPIKYDIMLKAKRQEFDVLVVWKLDRFARSLKEIISDLEIIKENGIRFISIRDGLDLNPNEESPTQTFYMQILGAFAELERSLIRERTLAGLERVKAEGRKLGRPKGAKDKRPRRKSGYYVRWNNEKKGINNNEPK
jgi:DNA invertase Pin-like site-specific DNA recombinase